MCICILVYLVRYKKRGASLALFLFCPAVPGNKSNTVLYHMTVLHMISNKHYCIEKSKI